MDRMSNLITKFVGSSLALCLAMLSILSWAVLGPVFQYSESWQLVVNTGTTIVTFLMVFIIQRAQNKDILALQLKLNELIKATKTADNERINLEDLSDSQLNELHKEYERIKCKQPGEQGAG